ncbi:MAG: hypothetical protein IJK51_06275 [Bacteroidaceae bacterium]|nr:hypothetical protein [Bacteroidaceae bacterium]
MGLQQESDVIFCMLEEQICLHFVTFKMERFRTQNDKTSVEKRHLFQRRREKKPTPHAMFANAAREVWHRRTRRLTFPHVKMSRKASDFSHFCYLWLSISHVSSTFRKANNQTLNELHKIAENAIF